MTDKNAENTDLEQPQADLPQEELELSSRQIDALERLDQLGGAPRQSPDEPYSKDSRIRAYQMIYEGRLGGPRSNGGRPRKKRAQAELADHVRDKLLPSMKRVLEEGLDDDDMRIRIQAFREAMKVERDESQLQLQEEKHDAELDKLSREELIAELFEIVGEASTATALGGIEGGKILEGSYEEIEEAEAEIEEGTSGNNNSRDTSRVTDSAGTSKNGDRLHRSSDGDGGKRPAANSGKRSNPFTEIARRRASN